MTATTPPPPERTPAGAVREFPVPGSTERARAWLAGEIPDGPEPRLAATVQLLQDGADGLEVFVLERAASMVFAPSMLVFPGGGVDSRDAEPAMTFGVGRPARLGLGADAEGWQVERSVTHAAVRELFEETGVLLASPLPQPGLDGGDVALPDVNTCEWPIADPGDCLQEHAALDARTASLASMMNARRMAVRGDLLVPVARWVTPPFEPRRYDTFFFRAAVPAGQEPDGRTTEAVRSEWVRPVDALAAFERGEVRMLPPTVVALESLAACASVEQALAAPVDLRAVSPELVETPDGLVLRVDVPGPA